jgi:phospholipid transport system substrate-binding protein
MKFLVYAVLFTLLFSQPGLTNELEEVDLLAKEKIGALIEILQDESLDKAERNTRVISLLTPIFDFPRMAQLSLGQKYWKQLSPEKQREFSDLFVKRIQNSYLEKLELFTDENVLFKETKQVKKRIHVLTQLVSGDETIEVLYKLYKSGNGWKIYDVEIFGVSIIQTYRSQLQSALKKVSIDDLLSTFRTDESKFSGEEQ